MAGSISQSFSYYIPLHLFVNYNVATITFHVHDHHKKEESAKIYICNSYHNQYSFILYYTVKTLETQKNF